MPHLSRLVFALAIATFGGFPLSAQTLRVSLQKTFILAETDVNFPNGSLEFLLTLFVVVKDADAKRLDWFDNFLTKHAQRLGCVGGDEHALTL